MSIFFYFFLTGRPDRLPWRRYFHDAMSHGDQRLVLMIPASQSAGIDFLTSSYCPEPDLDYFPWKLDSPIHISQSADGNRTM